MEVKILNKLKFSKIKISQFNRYFFKKLFNSPKRNKLFFLDGLKNKHKGKRGFVIGNGPSLCFKDLDMLKDEITVASNKIHLAFNKTSWRPSYYSVIDSYVLKNIRDTISEKKCPSFFLSQFSKILPERNHFYFLNLLPDGIWEKGKYLSYTPGFSDDIRLGIHAGENVTYFNVQLLAYMGCNPIVLIGVDFSFVTPPPIKLDDNFGEIYNTSMISNHFCKDYRPEGERWTQPNLKEMQMSFTYGLNHLHRKGVSLLNASRKTELLDVPKVRLEKVL